MKILGNNLLTKLICGNFFRFYAVDDDNKTGTDSSKNAPTQQKKPDAPTPKPGISEEEVGRRIEAARQEEKAKLYEEISTLQKSHATMREQLEAAQKTVTELTAELDTVNNNYKNLLESQVTSKDGKKKEVDIENLVKKSADTATEAVRKHYDAQLAKMQAQLDDARKKSHSLEIARYREFKIAEANGELIPELVTGDTTEEIDRSLEAAKKAYASIVSRVSGSYNPANTTSTPPPSPPIPPSTPVDPINPDALNLENPGSRRFGREGLREYAGSREKLMADLRKRYPRRNTTLVQQ